MNKIKFQWDEGNLQHIVYAYPERGNTVEEVESVFIDLGFKPAADRVDS